MNSRRGKFVFNPLGNASEAFYVCVPVHGGGTMNKGEHHIRIIPHKLVPPSLLALIAGVEAGEHFHKGKMSYG